MLAGFYADRPPASKTEFPPIDSHFDSHRGLGPIFRTPHLPQDAHAIARLSRSLGRGSLHSRRLFVQGAHPPELQTPEQHSKSAVHALSKQLQKPPPPTS